MTRNSQPVSPKLVRVCDQMNEMVRILAIAGLRQRRPDDIPSQRKRRLADLMLGPELAACVYGPLSEEL